MATKKKAVDPVQDKLVRDMLEIAALKRKVTRAQLDIAPDEARILELEAELRANMLAANQAVVRPISGDDPAAVTLVEADKYIVVDWALYDAYAIRKKAPEMYQRRASESSIKDRIANGEKKIPGVELHKVQRLSWRGVK